MKNPKDSKKKKNKSLYKYLSLVFPLLMIIGVIGLVYYNETIKPNYTITKEECVNETQGQFNYSNGKTYVGWIAENRLDITFFIYWDASNKKDVVCERRDIEIEKCWEVEVESIEIEKGIAGCVKDIPVKYIEEISKQDLTKEWLEEEKCECIKICETERWYDYKTKKWHGDKCFDIIEKRITDWNPKYYKCSEYKCGEYKVSVK